MSDYALELVEGTNETPTTTQLAPGIDLAPQAVTCDIDGAGASGEFVLALTIMSQDGTRIARTVTPQTFQPGDSGVATFAPFLGRDSEPVPPGGAVFAWILYSDDGVTDQSDVWLVDTDETSVRQLTNHADQDFADTPILSPDASRVAFIFNTPLLDRALWIVDVDGSNEQEVRPDRTDDPQWATDDVIVFQDSALRVLRINADGTGEAFVVNNTNTHGFDVEPNGDRVAYLVLNGAQNDLRIVDLDGTNDTLVLANVGGGASGNSPVWMPDGSRIVYPGAGGMRSVLPDGSGDQFESARPAAGFYFPTGSYDDALYFTDTVIFADWRIGRAVYGVGYSALAPPLIVFSSIFRGVPMVAGGRIYTVSDSTGPSGEEELVSVAPDGSDLRVLFTPDQSGAPLFQQVFLR